MIRIGTMFRQYISCAFAVILFLEVAQILALQTFKLPRSDEGFGSTPRCAIWNSSIERACGVRPRVNTQGLSQTTGAFGELPWQEMLKEVRTKSKLAQLTNISELTAKMKHRRTPYAGFIERPLKYKTGEGAWGVLGGSHKANSISGKPKKQTQNMLHLPSSSTTLKNKQVAILNVQEQAFLCSGVLVSSRGVLTASKCVSQIPPNNLAARVGEWDILSEGSICEPFQSEDIPVSKKYALSESKNLKSTLKAVVNHALTLLKLRRSPRFDEYPHVLPICLPETKTELTNTRECYVSGWAESVEECMSVNINMESEPTESITEETVQSAEEHENPNNKKCDVDENDPMRLSLDMLPDNEYYSTHPTDEGNYCKTASKIVSKIPVAVAPIEQCTEQESVMNDEEMCILPLENELCMADVGSPVICRMEEDEISENIQISVKYNSKSLSWKVSKKEKEERELKKPEIFMLVGVVTSSEACSANASQPIKAVSTGNIFGPLCKILGYKSQ